jgi:aspartate racemase
MTKLLGLIGGISPESTIDYYRLILDAYRRVIDDGSAPRILINSLNMQEALAYLNASDLDGLTEFLLLEIGRLHHAGADLGLITANTPHLVFDAVAARSPIPLISIVEATRDYAQECGFRDLGLFGTRFTMQARFYFDVFERAGMTLVVPDLDDQDFIHDKYMNELTAGIFSDATRERMLAIARGLIEIHGIDALILGGTELPLLLRDADIGVPWLDTTRIHVARAVEELLW